MRVLRMGTPVDASAEIWSSGAQNCTQKMNSFSRAGKASNLLPGLTLVIAVLRNQRLQHCRQLRQLFANHVPHQIETNIVIAMDQAVPQSDDVAPWNAGMRGFEGKGDFAGRDSGRPLTGSGVVEPPHQKEDDQSANDGHDDSGGMNRRPRRGR